MYMKESHMFVKPEHVQQLLNLNIGTVVTAVKMIDMKLSDIGYVHNNAVRYQNPPRKIAGVWIPLDVLGLTNHPAETNFIIEEYQKSGWSEVYVHEQTKEKYLVFMFQRRTSAIGLMLKDIFASIMPQDNIAYMMTWTETEDGAGRPDGHSLHSTLKLAMDARHNKTEQGGRAYSQPDMDPVGVYVTEEIMRSLETCGGFLRDAGDGSHYQRVSQTG